MDRSVRMAAWVSSMAALALLSACSTNPYVPPSKGETARLRLVSARYALVIAMSVNGKAPEEITGGCMAAHWTRINTFSVAGQDGFRVSENEEKVVRGKDYHYGLEKLGMPGAEGIEDNLMTELPIAADRVFVGLFEGMRGASRGGYYKCSLYYLFRPDPGKDYEAVYDYGGDRCGVAVYKLEQVGTSVQRTREPSATFVPNTCK